MVFRRTVTAICMALVGLAVAAPAGHAANATPSAHPVAVVKLKATQRPSLALATSAPSGVFVDSHGSVVGGWRFLSGTTTGHQSVASSADTSAATPATRVGAGGGTWDYGTYVDSTGYKHCWSFYYHGFNYHSATARFYNSSTGAIPESDKKYAGAGSWANAEVNPLYNAPTCQVYWDNNA